MGSDKVIHLQKLFQCQRDFVKAREWERFHTPKNLAMALAGEAAELLELFQWLTPEESETLTQDPAKAKALRDEMADVLFYLLRLVDRFGIDLEAAFLEKMEDNGRKYPTERSKGSAKKYTEY